MDDLSTQLSRTFGFSAFRAGQREVMEAVLARRDAMAVMPTGQGKSLCYQLPATLLPGGDPGDFSAHCVDAGSSH
ncbi:MAG: hypothetical protein IPL14_03145 [Nitrospira sp.]|nr:hypothetical protein [Nitrospira sp.]